MLHLFNFCSAVLLLDNKDLVNEIQYLHYCDTYNTEIIEYYQYILKSLNMDEHINPKINHGI